MNFNPIDVLPVVSLVLIMVAPAINCRRAFQCSASLQPPHEPTEKPNTFFQKTKIR